VCELWGEFLVHKTCYLKYSLTFRLRLRLLLMPLFIDSIEANVVHAVIQVEQGASNVQRAAQYKVSKSSKEIIRHPFFSVGRASKEGVSVRFPHSRHFHPDFVPLLVAEVDCSQLTQVSIRVILLITNIQRSLSGDRGCY
jgi:hypothetical protein